MAKKKTYGAVVALLLMLAASGGYLYYRPIENGTRERPAPASTEPAAPTAGAAPTETAAPTGDTLTIVTWNVRGYPEETAERRQWFTERLAGRSSRNEGKHWFSIAAIMAT